MTPLHVKFINVTVSPWSTEKTINLGDRFSDGESVSLAWEALETSLEETYGTQVDINFDDWMAA